MTPKSRHERKAKKAKTLLKHYLDVAGGDQFSPDHDNLQEIDLLIDSLLEAAMGKFNDELVSVMLGEKMEEKNEEEKHQPEPFKGGEVDKVATTWEAERDAFWHLMGKALGEANRREARAIKKAFPLEWETAISEYGKRKSDPYKDGPLYS